MKLTPYERRQEKLIHALEDYIVLLGQELNDCAPIAALHGWQSTRVKAGEVMRRKIAAIPNKLARGEKTMKDHRAKIVIEAERRGLMRIDALFLTSGGRVVKPGWGEYAAERFSDIILLNPTELERGVPMEDFNRRWKSAVGKWKAREARRINKLARGAK